MVQLQHDIWFREYKKEAISHLLEQLFDTKCINRLKAPNAQGHLYSCKFPLFRSVEVYFLKGIFYKSNIEGTITEFSENISCSTLGWLLGLIA